MTLVLKDIKNPDMDSEYILLYGSREERTYNQDSGVNNI